MSARLRTVAAAIALVVVCVMTPIATSGWWVRATVTDTDRFVETLAPLAVDPEITERVEHRLVDQVMSQVDRAQPLKRAAAALSTTDLPPALTAVLPMLAEPLREQTQNVVERIIHRIVSSPQFVEAWEISLRQVHAQAIDILEGDTGSLVSTEDGALTITLGTLIDTVGLALQDAGVPGASRLSAVDVALPVATVDNLATAQSGYDLLRTLGRWLPIATLLVLVAGIALARDRVRAGRRTALGIAAALVVTLLAVALVRQQVVGALPVDGQEAGDAMLGILTSSLRGLIRALVILALVVAAGLLFAGGGAAANRRRVVRERYDTVTEFAARTPYGWPAAAAISAVALGVVLIVDLGPVLLLVLLVLAVLAGVTAYVVRNRRLAPTESTTL